MKTLHIYQVDAFTSQLFRGNPAAVVPIEGEWPEDTVLQSIAAENNLAETAFFRAGADDADYELRWFTPEIEVQLCGHATLASAFVLFNHLGFKGETIRFSTRFSGGLSVTREDDLLVLDFPARPIEEAEVTTDLVRALGRQPSEVYKSLYNLLAVFESKKDVHGIEPDGAALSAIDCFGIIATAPGAKHDFVSRYFAPKAGILEDPVTGSAHCTLATYWSKRLGKSKLSARQVSRRSGELTCELIGDRVKLAGRAVSYLEGTIRVPEGSKAATV